MSQTLTRQAKRLQRHRRIRSKISGTAERPRLSVFCSNRHIYSQIIDDVNGRTLVSASTLELRNQIIGRGLDKAKKVGELIAERALAKGIKAVVFDRGGFSYAGRIKVLAEAARSQGLQF